MSLAALTLLAAFGSGIGLLIGSVGIGGVLLVPALVYLGGVEVQAAIAAAMFSYLFTGLVGTLIYAREGSIRWSLAGWLMLGAMPAAFAGAWAVHVVSAALLKAIIAAFLAFAGLNAVRPRRAATGEPVRLGPVALAAIGVVTGFLSALSGTGGPLVLVPILVSLRLPVLAAIGLSQAIQLPIAALATAGNLGYGRLDLELGLVLAAALTLGAVGGAKLAHWLPQKTLQRLVAWLLIGVALFVLANLLLEQGA